VVSSPAIDSIPDAAGRARAIVEAVQVLRPGGQLLITDIRAAGEYWVTLRQPGLADVATHPWDGPSSATARGREQRDSECQMIR
jgi:hypothetical protein